jgi:hypothetical protein
VNVPQKLVSGPDEILKLCYSTWSTELTGKDSNISLKGKKKCIFKGEK